MCTAGFWKDNDGVIHYFKNRMLLKMPKEQIVDFSPNGIFIKDENGRFEGLNKHGLFVVSLTMEPKVKRIKPRPIDINQDIMLKCRTAKEALRYFEKESKLYDMGFIELIGDAHNIFYIEVTPKQFASVDLTSVDYFACTNHGQLLINQGSWEDQNNSSHLRLLSAQHKLMKVKKYDDLKNLLSSHQHGKLGYSICSHNKTKSYTVGAYLYTPQKMQADICINGFPCKKGFKSYRLDNISSPAFGIYKD